ncbi:MAG: hypothetical protein ACXVEE_19565 [Polyangiales bacterium]
MAFGLVGLIAVGLIVGIAELIARVRRADAIAREVAGLPKDPSEESVDASSPSVRAFLRARIAGNAGAPASPPIASYLIGLLVMIGLLGTFMGLFESLKGAREALGAAADPATLRAGLSAPIQGLSRAFGTSAAGVSASAMLGLALVMMRRAESDALGSLAAYASGPLGPLTVARRTLAALESMARQGNALPEASSALSEGAASLGEVGREVRTSLGEIVHEVRSSMQATTGVVREELRSVARAVREDLRGSAESTAKAVSEAVSPRLDAAVAAVGQSGRAQSEAFAKALAAESEARIVREKAHAAGMQEAIARETKGVVAAISSSRDLLVESEMARADAVASSLKATADTVGASLLSVADAISSKLAAQAEREDALFAKLEQVSSKLAEELATHQRLLDAEAATRFEAHLEHLEQLRTELRADDQLRAVAIADHHRSTAEATAEKLASFVSSLREGDDERVTQVTARMERQLEALAASVSGSLDAVVKSTQAAPEAAARVIDDAAARLRIQLEAESAREARIGELVERVGTLATTVEAASVARLDAHAVATSEQLEAHLESLALSVANSLEGVMKSAENTRNADAARDERIGALLERFDQLSQRIDAQTAANAERILELEIKLEEVYSKSADAWTERLAAHQASVEDGVLRTTVVVKEAAEALAKGGSDIGALGELFGASVDRYREASDKWLTGLSIMRAAAERAATGDAQDLLAAYLEQTREVFDHTVQFQRQLFAELRRAHVEVNVDHPVGEAE